MRHKRTSKGGRKKGDRKKRMRRVRFVQKAQDKDVKNNNWMKAKRGKARQGKGVGARAVRER